MAPPLDGVALGGSAWVRSPGGTGGWPGEWSCSKRSDVSDASKGCRSGRWPSDIKYIGARSVRPLRRRFHRRVERGHVRSRRSSREWCPAEWCTASLPSVASTRRAATAWSFEPEFPLKIGETHAMAAHPSIDPAGFLHEHLAQASPDLLRSLLTTMIDTLMSAEADTICGADYGRTDPARVNQRNGLPPPRLRHPHGHPGRRDPQAALWLVLPGLAARTPKPRRSRAELGGGHLLPARGLYPPHGEAGGLTRHHQAVEIPGQCHGPGPRRTGLRVPDPATGYRPVPVRGRRRAPSGHRRPTASTPRSGYRCPTSTDTPTWPGTPVCHCRGPTPSTPTSRR